MLKKIVPDDHIFYVYSDTTVDCNGWKIAPSHDKFDHERFREVLPGLMQRRIPFNKRRAHPESGSVPECIIIIDCIKAMLHKPLQLFMNMLKMN